MSIDAPRAADSAPFLFESRFLDDHAGQIISDARTAIMELVANAYDAGATRVEIEWPSEPGEHLAVQDDGIGMTASELDRRWRTLNYDRRAEQGVDVEFPDGASGGHRRAFGRNGKGRFAGFFFSDTYTVETWRDGIQASAEVAREDVDRSRPFRITLKGTAERSGHGTRISLVAHRRELEAQDVRDVIGSKFLVDPHFEVVVDNQRVSLLDFDGRRTDQFPVEGVGEITVHLLDGREHDRTTHLRGVTWWVRRRMVGSPSWENLDGDGAILDGRTAEAKRFSFIVEADPLEELNAVKADWSGFHSSNAVTLVRDAVLQYVRRVLRDELAGSRKAAKTRVLERHRKVLGELPVRSKRVIGQFVDEIQERCPSMSQRDLTLTVEVLAKLESARSGYDLLGQLARCSADDLDKWNRLMEEWTASRAEIVLDELQKRLRLLERLASIVATPGARELQDIQPLFERGLWMFGPEYESVEFVANRTLTTVVREVLGGVAAAGRRRPDLVALPNVSVGAYAADSYGADGEIDGIRKVVIIELKRGQQDLTMQNLDQARDYAIAIQRRGHVRESTEIEVYLLGSTLGPSVSVAKYGEREQIVVRPLPFDTVLARARARTFNLQRRLERVSPRPDPEVEAVLHGGGQAALFDEGA